jgi:hypothetical protein
MSDKEAFLIRGHHLNNFYIFQKCNYTPERFASRLLDVLKRGDREAYIRDTIGDSDKTEARFQEGIRRVFETYVNLPDEHPVTITVGAPDGICNSCILGDHCKQNINAVLFTEGREAPYLLRAGYGDVIAVKKFLAVSACLALTKRVVPNPGSISSHWEHILQTPEQRDKYAVPVTAEAGYIKNVLQYWELDAFSNT